MSSTVATAIGPPQTSTKQDSGALIRFCFKHPHPSELRSRHTNGEDWDFSGHRESLVQPLRHPLRRQSLSFVPASVPKESSPPPLQPGLVTKTNCAGRLSTWIDDVGGDIVETRISVPTGWNPWSWVGFWTAFAGRAGGRYPNGGPKGRILRLDSFLLAWRQTSTLPFLPAPTHTEYPPHNHQKNKKKHALQSSSSSSDV